MIPVGISLRQIDYQAYVTPALLRNFIFTALVPLNILHTRERVHVDKAVDGTRMRNGSYYFSLPGFVRP
jgi:hypothetical protein